MSKEWEKKYKNANPPDLSNRTILFAYNLCLDKIKYVQDTSWIAYQPYLPTRLDRMNDVFAGLLFCMGKGMAHELTFSDEGVKAEMERLIFDEVRLGGQVGIMANYACLLGARSIIYPHRISPEIKERLDTRILVPQKGRLVPVRGIPTQEASTHYIFEFREGTEAHGIKAPRNNRFIASSAFDTLDFDSDFEEMLPHLTPNYSVISGFHLIAENYRNATFKDHIAKIKSHIETLKRNKNHRVHCEMAALNPKIVPCMEEIFSLADSVGLNECELSFLSEWFGKRGGKDIFSLFEAMTFLKEKFLLKRIHLHNVGYYLCMTENPQKEREALLFSSLAAAAKARSGEIKSISEIMESKGVPVSEKGIEEIKRLSIALGSKEILEEGLYENLVCIPTKVVDHPKSTVGLGDIISSAFFLQEENPQDSA